VLKEAVAGRQDVKWIYRHYPLSEIHPIANRAAQASECAAAQGQFWPFVDAVFERQSNMTEDTLTLAAGASGLDRSAFAACLASGAMKARVESDANAFGEGHIAGTPTFFVNGSRVDGMLPLEELTKMLDAARPQTGPH
jgi:protein-disulfide isomerase